MPQFGNYDPATFGWTHPETIAPLDYRGVQFPGGVRAGMQAYWTRVLDTLVPHIPGGLHPDWCWGYSDRVIPGTHDLSFHAYGLALDVNAPANPQHGVGGVGHYRVPANTGELLRPLGIEWGGSWTPSTPTDPMHIECHLSPGEVDMLMHAAVVSGQIYSRWYKAALGTRTLEQWDAGVDVADLQRILNAWYPSRARLATDGYFGPLTKAAVEYLQGKAHLTVSGVVGDPTYAVLHVKVGQ